MEGEFTMPAGISVTKAIALCLVAAFAVAAVLSGCSTRRPTAPPYLILYAFDAEGERLADEMTIRDSVVLLGRIARIGRLSGRDVVLAESGVGMTNAAMTTQCLIDRFRPVAVIFTGIAGAVDSAIHIGDIVACRQWRTHDYGYHGRDGFEVTTIDVYHPDADSIMETAAFDVDSALFTAAEKLTRKDLDLDAIGGRTPVLAVGGVGVSGNCFIDSREKREWLQETFAALVTDMESAAVGQVCVVNDIPFIVFRSASDLAGGSGSETAGDEMEQFFRIAADNSSRVVIELLSLL